MIEVKGVTHSLNGNIILSSVNITLSEGSIMGLVGINGAGKTTLLRLISGVYFPDYGDVIIDGIDHKEEEAREKLFFLPDDPYFTIYTSGNALYEMYKVFYPSMDRAVFDRFMSEFKLDGKKPIRNFSKGMRRQLYIALALASKTKYILLDEAFDGLDPLSRLAFKRAINEAVEQNGTGVLISSHSLRELEDFCDSYALIDNKCVAQSGSIAEDTAKYCKFQLAFADGVTEEAFAALPAVFFEINGRFVKIVLEGDAEEMTAELLKLSPTVFEQIPMDFEEMFIYEVQSRGYLK